MAIVTGMKNEVVYYRSARGRFTYSEFPGVRNTVKMYRRPGRYSPGVGNYLTLNLADRRAQWDALAPAQKAAWDAEGEEVGMTGYELFIQEGWKMGMDAIAGVGLSDFCYSNGAPD